MPFHQMPYHYFHIIRIRICVHQKVVHFPEECPPLKQVASAGYDKGFIGLLSKSKSSCAQVLVEILFFCVIPWTVYKGAAENLADLMIQIRIVMRIILYIRDI